MIYQPRNVSPSSKSIDVNIPDQYFSMEINTNSYVTAYQLYILNWVNDTVYSGSKTTLTTPLYNGDTLYIPIPDSTYLSNGNDYKWHVRLYQNEANMLISRGIVQSVSDTTTITIQNNINIKIGMYFKYNNDLIPITSYNSSNGLITLQWAPATVVTAGTEYEVVSDFLDTTPEYILYTRSTPIVTISQFPSTLTTRQYTFTGTYTQNNNEPIISHHWVIGIPEIPGTPGNFQKIYDSGDIYNANLTLTYDAFKSGVSYVIFLEVKSTYENMGYASGVYFDVSYNEIEYTESPIAELDCSNNAIKISWFSTNEYNPVLIDNQIQQGNIKPGTIGTNSFYIDKNLIGINPGNNIIIQNVSFTIVSYNSSTGLLTVEETVPNDVSVGDEYTISGITDIPASSAVTLLRNNPYNGVNSVDTGKYSLIYENEDETLNMGVLPDDYEITMQFKPDESFFYGTTGIFNDINPLTIIESDAADEVTGNIIIFVHKYDVCAGTPELNGSVANILPLGDDNTTSEIELAEDINLTNTPYIYFVDYGYIEKINSYDDSTKIATLNKDLPFTPVAGTRYVMLVTLKTSFYENEQNAWVLQNSPTPNADLDYRWTDSSNTWNDEENSSDNYWVEGGTAIERVGNHWWKLRITNTTIRLEEGGI